MQLYNYPDSDIDETPVHITVRYACGHLESYHLIREDLENYRLNPDGTYTDLHEDTCADCLIEGLI